MRKLAGLVFVVVVGCGLAGCGSGSDDNAGSPSSTEPAASTSTTTPGARKVEWTKVGTPITLIPPNCDAAKHCVYPATSTGTFSGDLDGSVLTGGATALDASGRRFAGGRTDLFVGTIAGCGKGTVIIAGIEIATMKDGEGDWEIVEGFGTGDLENGTGKGTVNADGIRAGYEGEIVC